MPLSVAEPGLAVASLYFPPGTPRTLIDRHFRDATGASGTRRLALMVGVGGSAGRRELTPCARIPYDGPRGDGASGHGRDIVTTTALLLP